MEGYLVISDISGYTAYLTGTEQEHAEEILQDLFHTLLKHTVPPLVVSKLEGDAILSYAPKEGFSEGQSLMEVVETIYAKFRMSRENMHRYSDCHCDACRNIPNLDLKFFVHYGNYSLLDIGGWQELSGPNVILIHRLMKNNVDADAYTLYTTAAIDALQMQAYCEFEMQPHSEQYEHLGEVTTFIQDMHQSWAQYQSMNRIYVKLDDPHLLLPSEVTIAAPPIIVWEFLSQPKTFPQWMIGVEAIAQVTGKNNERTQAGTVGHCVHGGKTSPMETVDLRPFDYVSYYNVVPLPFDGARFYYTYELTSVDGGTRVNARSSELQLIGRKIPMFLNRLFFKVFGAMMIRIQSENDQASLVNLRDLIERKIATGSISLSEPVSISDDKIDAVVTKYFADTGIEKH